MWAKQLRRNFAVCLGIDLMMFVPSIMAVVFHCNDVSYGQSKTTQDSERVRELDALIDSLANHNAQPKMVKVDGWEVPLFDESYDWKEQRRIHDALKSLAQQEGDDLWPRLLEHCADTKYSLTRPGDYPYNASVRNLCYGMALRDIECAYTRFLPRSVEQLHIVYSLEELIKWYVERKNKPLYELQIEMAEAAIKNMETEKRTWVTKEDKSGFVAKVREGIEAMKQEKKPILIKTSLLLIVACLPRNKPRKSELITPRSKRKSRSSAPYLTLSYPTSPRPVAIKSKRRPTPMRQARSA